MYSISLDDIFTASRVYPPDGQLVDFGTQKLPSPLEKLDRRDAEGDAADPSDDEADAEADVFDVELSEVDSDAEADDADDAAVEEPSQGHWKPPVESAVLDRAAELDRPSQGQEKA